MAESNVGGQRIGWKFSTELQAEYLSTFLYGLSNPGLLTRPEITVSLATVTPTVTFGTFSMLIEPTDLKNKGILTKITFTNNADILISESIVAIGFTYSFRNGIYEQSEWYGEFNALTQAEAVNYDGIIIATVQNYKDANDNIYFSVTTSGADISDALLRYEGWNPNCWLSVVSPRRAVNGKFNQLEVRKHHDRFTGYISGNSGVLRLSNCVYDIPQTPNINPDGTRGFMPHNYNIFKIQSNGFSICEEGLDGLTPPDSETPIVRQPGGVFAMVDASAVNPENGTPSGSGTMATAFTNKLVILPVEREDINVYYHENTLFIR